MELETKNLIIKKFIPEYISIMYETWGTDKDVGMYMPGFKVDWDLEGFKDYILKTYKDAYHTRLIIQEKKTKHIIGNISLYQEDSRSKSITLWIMKEYWNKGYGTEAVKGIIEELKKTNLECLYATSDARNIGAVRLLEKCGFECIDKIENYRKDLDGNIGDELLYDLEIKRGR